MKNDMRDICIKQGYIPQECKLDGMLVWLLIQDGKNPCDGCNADCIHRKCSLNFEKEKQIREELEHLNKEELERRKRIRNREELGTNSETIVYVDTDYDNSLITAIDPNSERGYSIRCRNGANETACHISAMCNKYHARQVIIHLNGFGISIYDCLKRQNLKGIDIVPIRCVCEKL